MITKKEKEEILELVKQNTDSFYYNGKNITIKGREIGVSETIKYTTYEIQTAHYFLI